MRTLAITISTLGLLCAGVSRQRTGSPTPPESPAQKSAIELDHVLTFAPQESPEAKVASLPTS